MIRKTHLVGITQQPNLFVPKGRVTVSGASLRAQQMINTKKGATLENLFELIIHKSAWLPCYLSGVSFVNVFKISV